MENDELEKALKIQSIYDYRKLGEIFLEMKVFLKESELEDAIEET